MAKKKTTKKKTQTVKITRKKSLTLPIIALLLNILILPGLGSLIGGKTKAGVWQIVLAVIGIILTIWLVGAPILIGAWIWGIITGIKLIQETR